MDSINRSGSFAFNYRDNSVRFIICAVVISLVITDSVQLDSPGAQSPFPTYTTTGYQKRSIDITKDGVVGGYLVHTRRANVTMILQAALGYQIFFRIMDANGPFTDWVDIYNGAHGALLGRVTTKHVPQQMTYITGSYRATIKFETRSICVECPPTHFRLLFTTVRRASQCGQNENRINDTYCMPKEASCVATAYAVCNTEPSNEYRNIFTDSDIVIVVFGFAGAILVGAGSACMWIKLRSNKCRHRQCRRHRHRSPREDIDQQIPTVVDPADVFQIQFDENGAAVVPKPPPYTTGEPPPYSRIDSAGSNDTMLSSGSQSQDEPDSSGVVPPNYEEIYQEHHV